MVDHSILWREAQVGAFLVRLLLIVLRAFQWPRTLTMGGLAAQALWPARGILAGCFSATYCLKGHLARILRSQAEEYTRVLITVHVDDFVQEVEGDSTGGVSQDICEAARSPQARLGGELRLDLAMDKCALAADSDETADQISTRLKELAGRGRGPRTRPCWEWTLLQEGG